MKKSLDVDKNTVLSSKNYIYKPFTFADADEIYFSWLNDPNINQYLEVRHELNNKENLLLGITNRINDPTLFFFSIISNDASRRPVGTCSLKINLAYCTASYGYLIGEKSLWGTNAALEAQTCLFNFGFEALGMRKITSSTYDRNLSSNFNFKRLGFSREGIRRKEYILADGTVCDQIVYGLLAEEWKVIFPKFSSMLLTSEELTIPKPINDLIVSDEAKKLVEIILDCSRKLHNTAAISTLCTWIGSIRNRLALNALLHTAYHMLHYSENSLERNSLDQFWYGLSTLFRSNNQRS